jgi:hypothetical protein
MRVSRRFLCHDWRTSILSSLRPRLCVLTAVLPATLALTVLTPQANARLSEHVVQLGSATLVLPLPEGLCALDPNQEVDAILLKTLKEMQAGISRVLLGGIACDDLVAARSGREVRSYVRNGAWLAPLQKGGGLTGPLGNMTRERFAAELRANMNGRLADEINRRFAERSVESPSGVALKVRTSGFALLDGPLDMLLMATAGNVSVDQGTPHAAAGVSALTLLRGYGVSFNMYAANQGDPSYRWLQAEVERTVGHAIARNDSQLAPVPASPLSDPENPLPSFAQPLSSDASHQGQPLLTDVGWGRIAAKAAGGAILGIIVWGIGAALRGARR